MHFVPKNTLGRLEQTGCGGHISAGGLEGVDEQIALVLLDEFAERTCRTGPGGLGGSEAEATPVADTPERRALLASIDALRERKTELKQDDYYAQLEPLLVRLARMDVGAGGAR